MCSVFFAGEVRGGDFRAGIGSLNRAIGATVKDDPTLSQKMGKDGAPAT
jgi:hypothetical protein